MERAVNSLSFQSDNGRMERRDGCFQHRDAPNRNGSRKDHVMAHVALPSPEVLRQLLSYDPETGIVRWMARGQDFIADDRIRSTFNTRFSGKEAFTHINEWGYRVGAVLGRNVFAHRVIWAMQADEWPDGMIDHINGDPKDNRWKNLRIVDAAENSKNARRKKTNKWGENGIHWNGKRWVVVVGGGSNGYVGVFRDIETAREVRKRTLIEKGYHENHGLAVGELNE